MPLREVLLWSDRLPAATPRLAGFSDPERSSSREKWHLRRSGRNLAAERHDAAKPASAFLFAISATRSGCRKRNCPSICRPGWPCRRQTISRLHGVRAERAPRVHRVELVEGPDRLCNIASWSCRRRLTCRRRCSSGSRSSTASCRGSARAGPTTADGECDSSAAVRNRVGHHSTVRIPLKLRCPDGPDHNNPGHRDDYDRSKKPSREGSRRSEIRA